MSLTQFAMVEELAFLVKDNLPCKHLILSMEEALINFLQDESSQDGVLQLEPMNSYNRLLLHRLADIFGFAHESVGEGEGRHLVLERCPETAIPPILVSDILWQNDEPQCITPKHQLLKRIETPEDIGVSVSRIATPSLPQSLEEREALYMAARERIFSTDVELVEEHVKQKPRTDPVVARRMIAHALGHRINSCKQEVSNGDPEECEDQLKKLNISDKITLNPKSTSYAKEKNNFQNVRLTCEPAENEFANGSTSQSGKSRNSSSKEYLEEQHFGAAKRMFAHALGRQSLRDGSVSKCNEGKEVGAK